MISTLIPLRSDRYATSTLTIVDAKAVELLEEGRAATLSGARLDTIRADLHTNRLQLIAMIADLRGRSPSGDARIDAINAILCSQASMWLSHIGEFLEQIEIFAARVR